MPLSQILTPAIELAEHGFPVSPISALMWRSEVPALTQWTIAGHASDLLISDPSAAGGLRGPVAGELFKNPALVRSTAIYCDLLRSAFSLEDNVLQCW